MMDNSKVISYEVMGGWPIQKMNIREIIESLGATYNEETKKWEIPESEKLDIYPHRYVDDGMGYGVDEEYIISVDVRDNHCNIFTEKELDYIDFFKEAKTFPGDTFECDGETYVIYSADETDQGRIFSCRKYSDVRQSRTFSFDEVVNALKARFE